MKVVIVGAKGQLGRTLTQTVPSGVQCQALDLPEFDIVDAAAVAALVADGKPDVIVNAAAYTAVDRAEQEAGVAFAVNADGPRNLARAAANGGIRLIHVSTDYVFDGTACSPYPPQAPCNPMGVYGRSKRQGEVNIQTIWDDAVILRTSWLYSGHGSNFLKTMLSLMHSREELKVVADQVGGPTSAATLAAAIWAAMGHRRLRGLYHWSDAGVASWYDFAVAIQEEALARDLLTKAIPIHPIGTADYPTPAKRPAYSVLDCRSAWRDLNVEPTHWRMALRQVLDGFHR
jgi:dTDP-4-dehydrorhamnose reductase